MNLPKLAIERPVFVTCLVILIMVIGFMSYRSLGVDLFPDVSFPFVAVTTPYKGAAPEEIETQISKPLEEQFSTLEGVKKVYSVNQEGFSQVTIAFTLETDSKDAEQRVRDRLAFVRPQLPKDIDEPVVQRMDPSDQPVIILSLQSKLDPYQAYDLADQVIKPQLSQVDGVGVVDISGGSKREIRVNLDRHKLNAYRVSATSVANNIGLNGLNVPVGKFETKGQNTLFRSVGEYNDLDRLKHTVVNFLGSDVAITVDKVGQVVDTVEDAQNYSSVNGNPSLFFLIRKQSKANTVAVVDNVLKSMDHLNEVLKAHAGAPQVSMVREDARIVRMNLDDVKRTIFIGIFLTVLVVFFFLGSFRSTLITITALPVSLLGAFILMNAMGFTLNLMTTLALSLAVGLLIDDAIVVRENIWRHIENGEDPKKAAVNGTLEVSLAVIATSSVIISVFLPIAFLKGTVGQFFRQFGMTICFAMAVSLFEAMVMGPLLSAYWAKKVGKGFSVIDALDNWCSPVLKSFDRFQTWLEQQYERIITWCVSTENVFWFVSHRLFVLLMAVLIFLASLVVGGLFVKFTFLPNGDNGEYMISLKMTPNTSLDTMRDKTLMISNLIRAHKEIALTSEVVGDTLGNDNTSTIYAKLTPWNTRKLTTSDLKDITRKELEPYRAELNPQVGDRDLVGNIAPFNMVLAGDDYKTLAPLADKIMQQFRSIPGLTDLSTNYDGGKAEFQAQLDPVRSRQLGVLGIQAGNELRTQIEGSVPSKFRQNGLEYDIRVRMQEDQRDLQKDFNDVWVPNTNNNQVRLSEIAKPVTTEGPSKINRLNRQRYIMISGQLGKGGALQSIIDTAKKTMKGMALPADISYNFIGQAEDMQDLMVSMMEAIGLAILFTFMILASLYESPILPFSIMASIPLAIVGAFVAMAITGQTLNIFSMISMIMLMGLVTKNAILLVDYTVQMEKKGMPRNEAIKRAGVVRLRPILMTTLALISGMIPTALALTEVGKFRQSMGVAVIGGLISSLLLTLVVVPSVYGYVDDFRLWIRRRIGLDPALTASRAKAGKSR